MPLHHDTIAAIATASGYGGVGIVRVSGKKAYDIGVHLSEHNALTPRYAHYGAFIDNNSYIIDKGITLFFSGPHSFTGEDIVEFQGHGGPVVLDQLLKAVVKQGARIAKPGEFSERAFLNNKINLTQAEAIADLINATSEQAARSAINSLQGLFSRKIDQLVEKLTSLRLFVEAAIDFPEEEVDFLQDKNIAQQLQDMQRTLTAIFEQARQGVLVQEGMTVAIVGKPNAGKSSLLNALAGEERAIVTDIAGTTRDVLREHIHLDDMPLHIIDTAGLRHSNDIVEKIGIERAWQEMAKADRILLLIDTSTEFDIEDTVNSFINDNKSRGIKKSIISVVGNKIDKSHCSSKKTVINGVPVIYLSVKTNEGLELLSQHLQTVIGYSNTQEGGFTARRRHINALDNASCALQAAQQQLLNGSGELLAEDLKICQQHLGEITGQISPDDLLGKIFSSFCIGK